MNVTDLTNAIMQGINAGGEQFIEGTLAAVLPILWLVILALHLGRPYMLGMMSKFTLRLGADLLWMVYAGARDFLIVTGFVMSFMYFFPDVVAADALPITGGLAATCLFAVLVVKLVSKGDDNDARVYTITSGLLALGALLYLIPYVLGTQANAVAAGGLGNLSTGLVSNTNVGLGAGAPCSGCRCRPWHRSSVLLAARSGQTGCGRERSIAYDGASSRCPVKTRTCICLYARRGNSRK